MTAEIVVMNRQAVALAADSAVTVETQAGGKVWQSANKIFGLSRAHSVGIMIYGQAELLGLPWETAIKAYRDQLGRTQFATIREYADDFLTFLSRSRRLFPSDVQTLAAQGRSGGYLIELREEMVRRIDVLASEQQRAVSDAEAAGIVGAVIDEAHDRLAKASFFTDLTSKDESRLRQQYRDALIAVRSDVFQELPLTAAQARKLLTVAVRTLTRAIRTDGFSGVVVTGFGEDELFPNLESLFFEGIVGGTPLFWRDEPSSADRENPSNIRAFAQSDMAVSFMEGIDPRYQTTLEELASQIFREYPRLIIDALATLPDDEREQLHKNFEAVA